MRFCVERSRRDKNSKRSYITNSNKVCMSIMRNKIILWVIICRPIQTLYRSRFYRSQVTSRSVRTLCETSTKCSDGLPVHYLLEEVLPIKRADGSQRDRFFRSFRTIQDDFPRGQFQEILLEERQQRVAWISLWVRSQGTDLPQPRRIVN